MKRTLKQNMVFSVFVILLILPSTPSFSQPPRMGPHPGMGMKPWKGEVRCWKASELNPTQDQMRGLEALQQGFSLETQLLRAQIFTKRLELRELLTDPNTKIDAIRSKSSEILEHQAKLEERSIEYLIKVKDILTAEQLKNWCPELEFPALRRMMHGPEMMGPSSPRKPPFQEGAKPE
ncbi:MAG: hypothetical protein A2156_15275 [Deltaproteobacteria bacterium RBG_16_48_10]|nr:MAG: hypothetical protein A2156_15275 [Deltaproteobacteria bacterium RBG_16_48_10]